jgi:outer membrane immunogenic protein
LRGSIRLGAGAGRSRRRLGAGNTGRPAQWTGFHLGGEVGAAWASYSWNLNPNYFNTIGATVLGSSAQQVSSAAMGGGFLGYDWAVAPLGSGQALLGFELGARTGSGLVQTQPDPWFPASDTMQSQVNWMASAVVRAGWAWQRFNLFAKGGWAGADVGFSLHDQGTGIAATLDKWVNGWTAGVGVEYMLVDRISLGVTWDYTDLSASGVGMSCTSCGFGVGLGTPVVATHIRINAVMARLTVRFGG